MRTNAIIPIKSAADFTGLEGRFVKIVAGAAALVTAATDAPIGVILDGAPLGKMSSIAIRGGGLAGTVKVKLDDSPGTVVLGTILEITATGTVKADTGGSETIVAIALEAGTAGELIEAVLLTASQTLTLQQSINTTVSGAAVGAVLTVSGQVTDAAGNPLAGRFLVKVWFGEAANDGIPYDFGELAAGANSKIIKEHTADAYADVLTHTDGSWSVALTVGSDDTVHYSALALGRVAVDSDAVDVP